MFGSKKLNLRRLVSLSRASAPAHSTSLSAAPDMPRRGKSKRGYHFQRIRRAVDDHLEDVSVDAAANVPLEGNVLVLALNIESRKLGPRAPWERSAAHVVADRRCGKVGRSRK